MAASWAPQRSCVISPSSARLRLRSPKHRTASAARLRTPRSDSDARSQLPLRPCRSSDVIFRAEFHALALYRERYTEVGLEHQIAFVIRVSADSHVTIALSRRRRDFATAQQTLLDRARRHMMQIYASAIAYSTLRTPKTRPRRTPRHAEHPAHTDRDDHPPAGPRAECPIRWIGELRRPK